ncbi:MAG: ATP-binding protein [Syntrophomonadaceae bacterium]|jgi:signal transduction histidine kinase
MVKSKSISTKILISYLAVVVFTFLVTALTFYPVVIGVLEKRAEIGLERQAWEIANTIRTGSVLLAEDSLPLTILLLGRSVESNYLWIDYRDKIRLSSQPLQFPEGKSLAELPDKLREDRSFDRSRANVFNNGRYLSAEVPAGSGETVLTFVSLTTLQAMYRETLLMIFGSLLAALAVALFIAFFLIRYLVRPLKILEDYARAVGNRQFDMRLEIKSDDELAQLAKAFNEMADRLKSYDDSTRRFFQNASHEMKTPLMSINGYAEGIRDGVFTGPSMDNAIEIIHKESLRLRNLVENMIDITILDQPHSTYFLPNDLCDIVEEAAETVGGYALERSIQVESQVHPNNWIIGDWDLLHSLFVNLLSNGIRHAKTRVVVSSSLAEAHTKAVITVQDDGDGFTAEDLEHAFDYFYSGIKSGSGLGLTIARKIVAEHSGTIRIYNNKGAIVELVLPVKTGKKPGTKKVPSLP